MMTLYVSDIHPAPEHKDDVTSLDWYEARFGIRPKGIAGVIMGRDLQPTSQVNFDNFIVMWEMFHPKVDASA